MNSDPKSVWKFQKSSKKNQFSTQPKSSDPLMFNYYIIMKESMYLNDIYAISNCSSLHYKIIIIIFKLIPWYFH